MSASFKPVILAVLEIEYSFLSRAINLLKAPLKFTVALPSKRLFFTITAQIPRARSASVPGFIGIHLSAFAAVLESRGSI